MKHHIMWKIKQTMFEFMHIPNLENRTVKIKHFLKFQAFIQTVYTVCKRQMWGLFTRFVVHEEEDVGPLSDHSKELHHTRRSEGTPRTHLLTAEPLQGDLWGTDGTKEWAHFETRQWKKKTIKRAIICSALPFWQRIWSLCWHLERCALPRRSPPWWTVGGRTPSPPCTQSPQAGFSDRIRDNNRFLTVVLYIYIYTLYNYCY